MVANGPSLTGCCFCLVLPWQGVTLTIARFAKVPYHLRPMSELQDA